MVMTGRPEQTPHIALLGDSIFDNAAYVPNGLPVIDHLRQIIPAEWQSTLLAIDGDITSGVAGQTTGLPSTATHLVISVGGNDALQQIGMFSEPASTVGEALLQLAGVRDDFRQDYRQMLWHVLGLNRPVAVCTIYNAVPGLGNMEKTALALFNEIILQEAFMAKVPVIDLRLICNEDEDYSLLSPIEPSHAGGEKIARAIASLLDAHDFASGHSTVISQVVMQPTCSTVRTENV
jgi:lysophospholipase L1-like esterase